MSINIKSYVSISPRILAAGQHQEIRITPKYQFVSFEGKYHVTILPRFVFPSNDRLSSFQGFDVVAQNNALCFSYYFDKEQEYLIRVVPSAPESKHSRIILSSVYALDQDLLRLKVVKGELHMHTTYSDGLESPEHRIIQARKKGHDFLAITDHNGYHGSLRAINVLSKIPNNMVALRGEEVHANFCPIHILSLGADHAIAPEVTKRTDQQIQRIQEIAHSYQEKLPEGIDSRSFAAAIDVFRRIRAAGGISVLCHIYWDAIVPEQGVRMGTSEQLVDAVVNSGEFDVFEITSGAPGNDTKANYLQEAYYREHLPPQFPVIGVTDSHTTEEALGSIFGKNYTIAFAENFSEEGILQAILQYKSVSVDAVVGNPVCHGSLRLCKYAAFLLQEYFPMHDDVVSVEGLCMDKILRGDMQYISVLEKLCADNANQLMQEWGTIVPNGKQSQ